MDLERKKPLNYNNSLVLPNVLIILQLTVQVIDKCHFYFPIRIVPGLAQHVLIKLP